MLKILKVNVLFLFLKILKCFKLKIKKFFYYKTKKISILFNMKKNEILKIILIIVSVLLVTVLGSIFVNIGMEWFNNLQKPSQWIPNVLIPIVWTVIYITFATILIVWSFKNDLPRNVIILSIINGVLNVFWCLTFFALKLTLVGNIVIILNLIFAFALIFEIKKHKPIYALITSIYPIWISIATTLNLALWILN